MIVHWLIYFYTRIDFDYHASRIRPKVLHRHIVITLSSLSSECSLPLSNINQTVNLNIVILLQFLGLEFPYYKIFHIIIRAVCWF